MATHSSILAWEVPWKEKPGGPQSMGLQRVRHDWSNLAAAAPWKMSGFPDGSMVKNPPASVETQEMCVPSLGQEDPLEEEMATHSSILAWEVPWTEEPGGPQSMGLQRVRHD